MWWSLSEITLFDSVLFSVATILILYFVGFGILKLIHLLNKSLNLGTLDFFQRTNFRLICGFIFIFLFTLIFSFLQVPFFGSALIIIVIAAMGFALSVCKSKIKVPKLSKSNLRNYFLTLVILGVLLATIFFSSMLISGFYGSTNDDGADHTLMTRVVLDNPTALLTRSAQPYASIFLNYPSGTHVFCAFFVTLLGVPIQKIVIMLSVILPCLIALAFYTTIKCLFGSKILSIMGLVVSAFFTIGLSWTPIAWGGLPFLLSLYLTISSMGFIYLFLIKDKINCLNAFLLGLIFFISIETYPSSLLINLLWLLLILSIKIIPDLLKFRKGYSFRFDLSFFRKNAPVLFFFLIPILLTLPYFNSINTNIVSVIQFDKLDSYNITLAEIVKERISFNWLFDLPALSLFFSAFGKILELAPYALVLILILLIPGISRKLSNFPLDKNKRSLMLIYLLMLLIFTFLTLTIYLKINFVLAFFNPERVWQHIFIIGIIMTAVVIFSVMYFVHLIFKRLFHHSPKTSAKKLQRNKILAITLLVVLIFSTGLLSIPIVIEQQGLYSQIGSSINTYQTMNQSDVLLMKWITENISSNGYILVSAGDSGQFVTAVTQRLTISKYSYLRNYTDLMELLTSNSSDLRAVPLMIEYNVSYVYIGSIATTYALQLPYYRHFNATQFLSTRYFTLAKEVGDTWLFQFNASAALTVYNTYGTTD